MIKSKNKKTVEIHGCLVCARTSNVLAVYGPDGSLVDCAVTSPGGHCMPDERQPLVAVIPTQQMQSKLLIKDGSPGMAKSWMMNKKMNETAPNGL